MTRTLAEGAPPARRRRTRGRWLLGAGLLLILTALGLRRFWFDLPEGVGPAGAPVPAAPFATVWSDRPVLLLGVGDSITAGFGATPGYAYLERLVQNPPDEFAQMAGRCLAAVLPDLRVRNLALSSSTSLDHLEILRSQLEVQDPAILGLVVMTTGGNDLIHPYGRAPPREGAMYGATLEQAGPWIARFEARVRAMVALLEERFPGGCHVFLADIYDPTDGAGHALVAGLPRWPDGLAIHRSYNVALRRVAATIPTVHLVPIHDAMLGHGLHCRMPWNPHHDWSDPTYWYLDNIEDPNDRGHDAIRRQFLLVMADILG